MLRVAVVEDDDRYREEIVLFLKRYCKEKRVELEITEYVNGREITENYCPCFEVIFLDIEMPVQNGMKAAEIIRRYDEDVVIVFITNVARYAVNGYEVGALDFILKPLRYESFAGKMNRILRMADRTPEKSIKITAGTEMYRIPLSKLLYVEVSGHYLIYHTLEQDIRVRGALKELEGSLLENGFGKCNSCYLVNLRHVKGIQDNSALVGGERLQISRARKKGFVQALADHVGSL